MILPKTMKAAILTKLCTPLMVTQVELPNTLSIGQVLVKIHYSGICGSQLGEIDGAKGEDKYLPHLLGHEASGTVISTGPGVRFIKEGDKVVLHWRKSLGIESEPPFYSWKGSKVNAGWVTTFNEYAIVSENRLTVIPENSDLKVAALFGCAVTTGFGVVINNAQLKIGESIMIYGAGGIGLNMVQAAALTSAYPIIAVDLDENKLQLASKIGATHVINARTHDPGAQIKHIVGSLGLDCFIDNTGQPDIIKLGYEITHSQGRVTLVGVPKKGEDISIYSLPLHFGKKLSGSHGGEALPHIDIPRYYNLFQKGIIKLQELITACYSLEQINEAINDMKNGVISGRCLIEMNNF